jgi:methionine-rich copper-binding protein CopC
MAGVRRCFGLLLILLTLVPSSAVAHSNSVETSPAQGATLDALPAEATLTFDEAPTTADVVLASPDGTVHKLTSRVVGPTIRVRLPSTGPGGGYELSYRVVSPDGHPVSGSVRFTVRTGAAAEPAPPRPSAEPDRGLLVPVVMGLAVLGIAATVFAARSIRR